MCNITYPSCSVSPASYSLDAVLGVVATARLSTFAIHSLLVSNSSDLVSEAIHVYWNLCEF